MLLLLNKMGPSRPGCKQLRRREPLSQTLSLFIIQLNFSELVFLPHRTHVGVFPDVNNYFGEYSVFITDRNDRQNYKVVINQI